MNTSNKLAIKSLFSTIRKMKIYYANKSKTVLDFSYANFLNDIRNTINQLRMEQDKPLWFKKDYSIPVEFSPIFNGEKVSIPFVQPVKIVVNPSTTLNDDLSDTKNRIILESHKNSLYCDNPKVKYRRFEDKGFNDDLNPYGKLLADNIVSYYDVPKVDPMKKQKEEKRVESKPVYYRVNSLLARIESRFKPLKSNTDKANKKLAKIRWKLFSNLFSRYPINPEHLEDQRVLFIFRYIAKIRQGIKIKFDANKTIIKKAKTIIGNRVDKSKGYKSNHWTKDHDLTRITIQEAFVWCLKSGKKLTPKILIYTANKQMSEQKGTQRKLDKVMWSNRLDLKTLQEESNRKLELETRLNNFKPATKGQKTWHKIWTMFFIDNIKKSEIMVQLGLSKSGFFKSMGLTPSGFEDFKPYFDRAKKVFTRK